MKKTNLKNNLNEVPESELPVETIGSEEPEKINRPLPPHILEHELKNSNMFDFSADLDILEKIFEDKDTASAISRAMKRSPIEMQIILKLVLDLYKKIEYKKGE